MPLGCTNAQHSACSFQYFHWEQVLPVLFTMIIFLALQCKTVLSSFLRSCNEDRNEAVRPKG